MNIKNAKLDTIEYRLKHCGLTVRQALEQAYCLGQKEKSKDDEPETVRQGPRVKTYEVLTLDDLEWK